MKTIIYNDSYDYKGFGNCESKCHLFIFENDGKYHVILTELDDNPGTSVTNMIENLVTNIVYDFDLFQKTDNIENDVIFYEKYEDYDENEYDEVTFYWNEKIASSPKWKRISNYKF